jgi:hypothetical protein
MDRLHKPVKAGCPLLSNIQEPQIIIAGLLGLSRRFRHGTSEWGRLDTAIVRAGEDVVTALCCRAGMRPDGAGRLQHLSKFAYTGRDACATGDL